MKHSYVIVLLVLALGGCAADNVSPTDQALLADGSRLHQLLSPALVDARQPKLARYLQLMRDRIVAGARQLHDARVGPASHFSSSADWMFEQDVAFHIVAGRETNLLAPGSRHLYIYQGLMNACESEEDFAAVLCHAYAHLYARHAVRAFQRDPNNQDDDAMLAAYVGMKFSPADESAAQAFAFTLYTRAGWEPQRFAGVFQRVGGASLATAVVASDRQFQQPTVADAARFEQLKQDAQRSPAASGRAALLLSALGNCLGGGDAAAMSRARQALFPPTPAGDNPWGKGLPGGR